LTLAGWCKMHSGCLKSAQVTSRCTTDIRSGSRTHLGIWSVLGQMWTMNWNRIWAVTNDVWQVHKNTSTEKNEYWKYSRVSFTSFKMPTILCTHYNSRKRNEGIWLVTEISRDFLCSQSRHTIGAKRLNLGFFCPHVCDYHILKIL